MLQPLRSRVGIEVVSHENLEVVPPHDNRLAVGSYKITWLEALRRRNDRPQRQIVLIPPMWEI